ncbi:MAG TPA: hypothetical protein VMK12_32735 [Anaeromyxobacteraceae bacterium]|nr:hypothetical protein [Anaeromyxobacteraceae bacterium]
MGRILCAAIAVSGLALSSCAVPAATRPTLKAGPEEREKAACAAGRYPQQLGASALAQARYEDLEAQRNGTWSTFATARLLDERAQFDKRCEAWRRSGLEADQVAAK